MSIIVLMKLNSDQQPFRRALSDFIKLDSQDEPGNDKVLGVLDIPNQKDRGLRSESPGCLSDIQLVCLVKNFMI